MIEGWNMAKKPTNIVSCMERDYRFYDARDVHELGTLVSTRHPGNATEYRRLLQESVNRGRIVKVKKIENINGKVVVTRGYASKVAVEAGKFLLEDGSAQRRDRLQGVSLESMAQPALVMA